MPARCEFALQGILWGSTVHAGRSGVVFPASRGAVASQLSCLRLQSRLEGASHFSLGIWITPCKAMRTCFHPKAPPWTDCKHPAVDQRHLGTSGLRPRLFNLAAALSPTGSQPARFRAVSAQRRSLHHKTPTDLAPPSPSHRNPVAPGKGTESSQVSWETQHTKVPLDAALCYYLCINREGTAASSLFYR